MNLNRVYEINLIEVFRKYTDIIEKSNKYWICCLLHKEKTPSCTINVKRFYCFGCGANGNIITFYMKYFELTFSAAIIQIHKDFNIPITESNITNYTELTNITQYAAKEYNKNLHIINKYIQERDLNQSMIDKFQLGYSDSHTMIQKLIEKGFSLQNIYKTGILLSSSLDTFNNRLIFPLINISNNVVGFAGRAISSNIMPKYLNSRDTDLFHKSNFMYGEHLLTTANNYAIIVEGYMDVISAYKIGLLNVVSVMGTAISEYAIKTLFNYVNNIYIMFDADDAGINGIRRNLPILCRYITHIKRIYVCKITKYKDLDEIVTKDKNSYNVIMSLLHNAIDIITWGVENSVSIINVNTTEIQKKIMYVERVKKLCAYIDNDITRQVYVNSFIENKTKHLILKPKISNAETQLLSLLLQNADIIELFIEKLLEITFKNEIYEEIRIILTLGLIYRNNIHNILLKISSLFSDEYDILIKNPENKYIIINRSFMITYITELFGRV